MPAVPDSQAAPTTDDLEARIEAWLRESSEADEPRRVVRIDGESVLVSKFEPGFAAELHALLDRLPELFDEAAVSRAYAQQAASAGRAEARVAVWHRALRTLLATLGVERGIDDAQQGLVRVGIDSVRAVLDSVLWSTPAVGDDYTASAGERSAYRDALARLEGERELFTRYYGTFEGRRVENHCPGAAFARTMLAQAWTACTGGRPPA